MPKFQSRWDAREAGYTVRLTNGVFTVYLRGVSTEVSCSSEREAWEDYVLGDSPPIPPPIEVAAPKPAIPIEAALITPKTLGGRPALGFEVDPNKDPMLCMAIGCDKERAAHRLCRGHYQRAWRAENLPPANLPWQPKPDHFDFSRAGCAVIGCQRDQLTRCVCKGHYRKISDADALHLLPTPKKGRTGYNANKGRNDESAPI